MKVVLVTGSLGEGAGGLASAVRGWALALARAGVDVTLFCLDLTSTFGVNRPPENARVTTVSVPCWIEPRTRLILAPGLKRRLFRHCVDLGADVIHANGLWLPGTRIAVAVAQRLRIPVVVSPHGHVQRWAMAHRPLKKRAAWLAYGRRSLGSATLVQAASVTESAGIRALGVRTPIACIPNAVDLPDTLPAGHNGGSGVRTVLFLSRIHPSKGLLDLVWAWARLRPAGWRVLVAGPDEVGHFAEVQREIARLGLTDVFDYVGPVPYEQRWRWYGEADLFVLPTYSENFGLTVAEALGAGVPVITTRAASWGVLEERGCGWWIEPGPRALAEALSEAVNLDDARRWAMGARGRAYVLQAYSAPHVAHTLLAAYRWAGEGGVAPRFIAVTGSTSG